MDNVCAVLSILRRSLGLKTHLTANVILHIYIWADFYLLISTDVNIWIQILSDDVEVFVYSTCVIFFCSLNLFCIILEDFLLFSIA